MKKLSKKVVAVAVVLKGHSKKSRDPKYGYQHGARPHHVRRSERLERIDRELIKAINSADERGYTGMVGSKGGYVDDPKVQRLMKLRDKALAQTRAPKVWNANDPAWYGQPRRHAKAAKLGHARRKRSGRDPKKLANTTLWQVYDTHTGRHVGYYRSEEAAIKVSRFKNVGEHTGRYQVSRTSTKGGRLSRHDPAVKSYTPAQAASEFANAAKKMDYTRGGQAIEEFAKEFRRGLSWHIGSMGYILRAWSKNKSGDASRRRIYARLLKVVENTDFGNGVQATRDEIAYQTRIYNNGGKWTE